MTSDVDTAQEQQRALYGEPLADLVGRLRDTFGLTQARFASLVGLSAPMLSQLVSGQRVKIGNPAVVRRLEGLVELADRAGTLTSGQVDDELARIAEDTSTLTDTRRSVLAPSVTAELRRLASAADLRAAADAVADRAPALAEVLRAAADG